MRELSDRRGEGQILGYLGRARGRLCEFELARKCFASGYALLKEVSDTLSLGVLLCDRAECEWNAGNAAAAHLALKEARELAQEAGAGKQSELGQALTRVADLVGAAPSSNSAIRT